MTALQELQEALTKHKADRRLAVTLKNLQLTPSWKKVIEEGFIQGLATKLVSELVSVPQETKDQHLAELTGISAFQQYLKDVLTNGEFAEQRIEETEAAITELLGEEV